MQPSLFRKAAEAIGWRLRRRFGDPAVDFPAIFSARLWRRALTKTAFIGITGSAGKTTTKELLLQTLSAKRRVIGNPGTLNVPAEVAKLLLRTRRSDQCCISEIGAPKPRAMDAPLDLLQPNIGIVTVIGDDHLTAYTTREAIAQEKGKLIARLPRTGVAVLNADDALVLAMQNRAQAKVITYGESITADVRATDISAAWPDRLAMTINYNGEERRMQTQLCGAHLTTPVLAAIAGSLAAGLTLEETANGIASAAPFTGRMQPVFSGGITYIRDDFKAPLWTVDACLEFMQAARAKRKIIVIGMLSDLGIGVGAPEKYAKVARLAQDIADFTIFVGPWASHVLKARKPGSPEGALRVFSHLHSAVQYMDEIAQEGDLVLLKGTNKQDHLQRIILSRTNEIACWRSDCQRSYFCDECPDRMKPAGPHAVAKAADKTTSISSQYKLEPATQVLIGLGNPEAKFDGSPHNVGYAAVDQIANSLQLSWESHPQAWFARGEVQGRSVCLLKVRSVVNHTGEALKQIADGMHFDSQQCILLYDDLDMDLGAIRTRVRGGAAGHKGVASILEAFQTDEFRRVKIGVGHAKAKLDRVHYVTSPFDSESHSVIDHALVTARDRALEMAINPTRHPPDRGRVKAP